MSSPYAKCPKSMWLSVTKRLIEQHPLDGRFLLDCSLAAWDQLWKTKVGTGKTSIALKDVAVPSTVIGYFFEILFAKELQNRLPGNWRGQKTKGEKDLVCVKDQKYSIEVKTSGQMGLKIYGNRSYGQKSQSEKVKEKSGYYLTVNFVGTTLTLLRFGWIDATDWKPQKAPTGQMAGLTDEVYKYKLIDIPGRYRLSAPVEILGGIGAKTAERLHSVEIFDVDDLMSKKDKLTPSELRLLAANQEFLKGCQSPD